MAVSWLAPGYFVLWICSAHGSPISNTAPEYRRTQRRISSPKIREQPPLWGSTQTSMCQGEQSCGSCLWPLEPLWLSKTLQELTIRTPSCTSDLGACFTFFDWLPCHMPQTNHGCHTHICPGVHTSLPLRCNKTHPAAHLFGSQQRSYPEAPAIPPPGKDRGKEPLWFHWFS